MFCHVFHFCPTAIVAVKEALQAALSARFLTSTYPKRDLYLKAEMTRKQNNPPCDELYQTWLIYYRTAAFSAGCALGRQTDLNMDLG